MPSTVVSFRDKVLLLGLLMSLSSISMASELLISRINRMAIDSYLAVNAFYNYSENGGAKRHLEETSRWLNEVRDGFNAIEDDQTGLKEGELIKLKSAYLEQRKLVNQNVQYMKENGFPDLRLAYELAEKNKEFTDTMLAIKERLVNSGDSEIIEAAEECRKIAITAAILLTKYTARSTSSVSQLFQGSDQQQSVADSVKLIDDNFKLLEKFKLKNVEAEKALASARTKWKFIRASYLNYNDDNVNYAVNRFTKSIIRSILKAESAYSR